MQHSGTITSLKDFAWACVRLGRYHTLMGFVIFTAPTMLTVALYHAAHPSVGNLWRAFDLMLRVFICTLAYRGVGVVVDDIVDREIDAGVERTKNRPLPAGDISVRAASIFCLFHFAATIWLTWMLLPAEAFMFSLMTYPIGIVYPFLKFHTHWAQLCGSGIMATMTVIAWISCRASPAGYNSVFFPNVYFDVTATWQSLLDILCHDGPQIAPILALEWIFSFMHETVYGCQDTPEDLFLGIFSTSILFGYEGTKRLVLPFTTAYLCLLSVALNNAHLHWPVLILAPALILLPAGLHVQTEEPKSCAAYARRGIFAKLILCVAVWMDYVYIEVFATSFRDGLHF